MVVTRRSLLMSGIVAVHDFTIQDGILLTVLPLAQR